MVNVLFRSTRTDQINDEVNYSNINYLHEDDFSFMPETSSMVETIGEGSGMQKTKAPLFGCQRACTSKADKPWIVDNLHAVVETVKRICCRCGIFRHENPVVWITMSVPSRMVSTVADHSDPMPNSEAFLVIAGVARNRVQP